MNTTCRNCGASLRATIVALNEDIVLPSKITCTAIAALSGDDEEEAQALCQERIDMERRLDAMMGLCPDDVACLPDPWWSNK